MKPYLTGILAVLCFFLAAVPAQAYMIGTPEVLATSPEPLSQQRAELAHWMQREEVQAQWLALGVNPEDIAHRLEGLTDAEITLLAQRLDELPAGAGAGAVVGAVVVIFVVFVITDVIGATDIFPFIRPVQ